MLPKKYIRRGRTLYLQDEDILVIGDIHFGKCKEVECDIDAEYTNKYKYIRNIISDLEPTTVILNGDIFYNPFIENWNPLRQDKKAIKILEKLQDSVNDFILLKGNHELTLGGFTDNIKHKFKTEEYYEVSDNTIIHHGHDMPKKGYNNHIISHMHPLRNGKPVFHFNEDLDNNSYTIVLPAFCKLVDGVDIRYYGGKCPVFDNGQKPEEYDFEEVTKNIYP